MNTTLMIIKTLFTLAAFYAPLCTFFETKDKIGFEIASVTGGLMGVMSAGMLSSIWF